MSDNSLATYRAEQLVETRAELDEFREIARYRLAHIQSLQKDRNALASRLALIERGCAALGERVIKDDGVLWHSSTVKVFALNMGHGKSEVYAHTLLGLIEKVAEKQEVK